MLQAKPSDKDKFFIKNLNFLQELTGVFLWVPISFSYRLPFPPHPIYKELSNHQKKVFDMFNTRFTLLSILILSFQLLAQREVPLENFSLRFTPINEQAHKVEVMGSLANGVGIRMNIIAQDFQGVFYNSETKTFDGVYILTSKNNILYIKGGAIHPKVIQTGIEAPNGIKFKEVFLHDTNFQQRAVVFHIAQTKDGMFSEALHFFDDILEESFTHFFVSFDEHYKIEAETFYSESGLLLHRFKTGDSYFSPPTAKRLTLLEKRKQTIEAFRKQQLVLPPPPELVTRDFKIIKKSDITQEQIAEAKKYLGSQDFRNIMENYMEASVAVLGESGEGKTYIARQFFIAALAGLIPSVQIEEVLLLTKEALGKNTQYVGQSEEKLDAVLKYYEDGKGKRFIFADEIHNLKGVGTSAGDPNGALQGLKTAMGDGTFKMLATTTLDEFNSMVGGDSALERRFFKFRIKPKTHEEIIKAVRFNADKRGVKVSNELIEKIIYYSSQFDVAGVQPAKAIKLVAKTIAKHKIDFPHTLQLEEEALNNAVAQLYNTDPKMLDPQFALNKAENLESELNKKVIGLSQVKKKLVEATRQRYLGMTPASRPPLRMLLLGPPGVGKSHIAKVFGEGMGYETTVISLNNYRGHPTADAFLNEVTSVLRKNAFANIVLDEFEKASPAVKESTLQMLNDGEFRVQEKMPGSALTRPINVSTKNANFILTSNLGDEWVKNQFMNILKIETEKTKDLPRAESEAQRVFEKKMTKPVLEKMLIELGFNSAVMDRMDHILAVTPPNFTEFQANIEMYSKKFFKDYRKKNGLSLKLKNYEKTIKALMSHYQIGMSNRDAQKIIAQVLLPEISDKLTSKVLNLKSKTLSLDLEKITYKSKAPKTTENLKKLINIHELRGHWLANFMLEGKNSSNYVTIIPGEGYLGYVRPKVNFDMVTEQMQTFTGLLKRAIVLEAGHRAEALVGIYGLGAGNPDRNPNHPVRDDLGKINKLYDAMIANKMIPRFYENHSSAKKAQFKIQMGEIIREMTDFILTKGNDMGIGQEMIAKLQKEGELHGEYLDAYAEKLTKELKINPEKLLDEAMSFAKSKFTITRKGIGFKPQSVQTLSQNPEFQGIEKLIKTLETMIKREREFFSGSCDGLFKG